MIMDKMASELLTKFCNEVDRVGAEAKRSMEIHLEKFNSAPAAKSKAEVIFDNLCQILRIVGNHDEGFRTVWQADDGWFALSEPTTMSKANLQRDSFVSRHLQPLIAAFAADEVKAVLNEILVCLAGQKCPTMEKGYAHVGEALSDIRHAVRISEERGAKEERDRIIEALKSKRDGGSWIGPDIPDTFNEAIGIAWEGVLAENHLDRATKIPL